MDTSGSDDGLNVRSDDGQREHHERGCEPAQEGAGVDPAGDPAAGDAAAEG
jgi:hypothetical protein